MMTILLCLAPFAFAIVVLAAAIVAGLAEGFRVWVE